MFKWKVYVYKNVNGREESFEREFDNPQDFQEFSRHNNWSLDKTNFFNLWLWDWTSLNNYFEKLIDRRIWLPSLENSHFDKCQDGEDCYNQDPDIVDLNKYEDEIQKIEYQKKNKEQNLKSLKDTLEKLKNYKNKFKDENREDMVSKIDEDIKKVKEEINNLEK